MHQRLICSALALFLTAGRSEAHAFQTGAGFYEQFIEGAGVILSYPDLLLPLFALGLLLSLWDPEGMVRVWPGFLAAQLLGILLAPVAGSWIPIANLSIGIGVAVSAALLPRHGRFEAIVVSMVVGLSVITVSLEGHRLFELPLFIHAGILFAASAVTAFSAGLSRLAMEKVKMLWMRLVWRIAASWIAAVLMLYLAFTVSVGSQG